MSRCRQTCVAFLASALSLSLASAFPPPRAQQEKPSPTSDYQYRKDYPQVEGIMKETDDIKRGDALLAFVKEHPQSRMIPFVWGYLVQIMATQEKTGAWERLFAIHNTFIDLEKDEKAAVTPALTSLMGAYYRHKDWGKAAEIAEKFYAATPDKGYLGLLSECYKQLNNTEKYFSYADKIVAEFPIEQSYDYAYQLSIMFAQKNDLNKSAEYAEKVMNAFGDKVPSGIQESAWNSSRVSMCNLLGLNAYAKKDYAKALEQYDKLVKFDAKNDTGHYYIGMCKWRNQDLDGAVAAFAKASVLNKPMSKKAQEYLEQIYKPRHNNTLDGLEEVLAKAKTELGIG